MIERLSMALNKASDEWDWKFSYAPKPGQQRIKITGWRIDRPEISKTVIFTEELCKTLSTTEMVQHVLNLLPYLPVDNESSARHQVPVISQKPMPQASSLHSQYQTMRKSYRMNVADIDARPGRGARSGAWLSFLGISLQNLQLTRK